MKGLPNISIVAASLLALSACQGQTAEPESGDASQGDNATAGSDIIPFFGDGYPATGDPCRRVGESNATVNYLDDSADLVGCPDPGSAKALGGTIVATIAGTTLVSVSRRTSPNAGTGADALVAGTDYNATAEIECSGYRQHPAGRCPAGVKRDREGGITTVEIEWPAGDSRALFFKDGKVLSANTNEADGSAAFTVTGERKGDTTIIRIGPERYVIPDAFLTGG